MQSLNVLADPTRQRIVEMLADGALRAGEIASRFEVSAPAISQHLKVLRDAKLVRVQRDAQRRIYELNPEGFAELAAWVERLNGFWSRRLATLERALDGTAARPAKPLVTASRKPTKRRGHGRTGSKAGGPS